MTKYVEWNDPWPGIDENGQEVTCNRITRMTVEDAIKATRYVYKDKPKQLDPQGLLDECIIINWASTIEVEDK